MCGRGEQAPCLHGVRVCEGVRMGMRVHMTPSPAAEELALGGEDGQLRRDETTEDAVSHGRVLLLKATKTYWVLKVGLTCSCLHFRKITLAWRRNRDKAREGRLLNGKQDLSLLFHK